MKGDIDKPRKISTHAFCCKIPQSQINHLIVVSKGKIRDKITIGYVNDIFCE